MKVSFEWLKEYAKTGSSPEKTAELLTGGGLEVKGIDEIPELGDKVFEAEITSNRPDWLSVTGVAREISALQGTKLVLPSVSKKIAREKQISPKVEILEPKRCPYYTACLIEGVEFGDSPEFIAKRLKAVGLRPINLIVDITNYVLLELGQPLHAFDHDLLQDRRIIVRKAHDREKIVAINGTEYVLSAEDLVIADGGKAVAIAGVMGGRDSEVSLRTKNILLESAYFAPGFVRRTSRRLGIVTESSYRFERGVDPVAVDTARERAIDLILRYAKKTGKVSAVAVCGKNPFRKRVIRFPLSEAERILGIGIPEKKAAAYLVSLGLGVRKAGKNVLSVAVPSFREDLVRPIDLVEEIARLHGYDKIPGTLPVMKPVSWPENAALKIEKKLREIACGAGFNETVTFSLLNEKIFQRLGADLASMTRIVNPQNKELTILRPTLVPSLLEVVKTNIYRAGGSDIRIFEIANAFGSESKGKLPEERMTFAFALAGGRKGNWLEKPRNYSLFDAKGLLEVIAQEFGIRGLAVEPSENVFYDEAWSFSHKGELLGAMGKISRAVREFYDIPFEVSFGEIGVETLASLACLERSFTALPKYPAAKRDIAVVVKEEVPAEAIVELIRVHRPAWIKGAEVIDLYRGGQVPKGKKSLAFSIEYRSDDHTLTAEDVNQVHGELIALLKDRMEAELRA